MDEELRIHQSKVNNTGSVHRIDLFVFLSFFLNPDIILLIKIPPLPLIGNWLHGVPCNCPYYTKTLRYTFSQDRKTIRVDIFVKLYLLPCDESEL